jgi:hypothetical protein
VSRKRLRLRKGSLIAGQRSAEGIVGTLSARLVRHSKAERRSQQIGQARNGD